MREALQIIQRPDFLPQIERRTFLFFQRKTGMDVIFPSRKTEKIASGLYLGMDEFTQSAWDILRENMHVFGDEIFLSANKEGYPDMWFRDCIYAMEFADDPRIDEKILRSFERRQKENGQIPTGISKFGSAYWLDCDDETTMLYLIWSAKLAQRTNGEYKPNTETIKKALGFIRSHVENGKYYSQPGERKGWLDAYIHQDKTVITQNQGLYAVSLHAAQNLEKYLGAELLEKTDYPETAIREYRNLAVHGYLPFSESQPEATDASVLYPEYLMTTIFGPDQKMLDKDVVEKTVNSLPVKDKKIMVLAKSPNGECFEPSEFIPYRKGKSRETSFYQKGEYQNAGFWPYWAYNAISVGRLHQVAFQPKILEAEKTIFRYIRFDRNDSAPEKDLWPECVNSDDSVLRPRQLWNLGILGQQRNVYRILNS